MPAGTTEASLRAFLGLALRQAGGAAAAGKPLASLHLSGRHAFVGARSDAEALALLACAGICYRGTRLRVKRPSKYAGTDPPRRGARGPTSSRTLRGAPPLKRRTTRPSAPRRRPRRSRRTSVSASWTAFVVDAPSSSAQVARRLATLAAAPTASVVVRGALAAARALDAAAADPAVLADVHAECARYGAVERVALAAGDVVVDFALVDDAVACLAALKFKRFCGAQLSVEFLEGNRE